MKDIWVTLKRLFEVLPDGAKGFYIAYAIFTALLAGLDVIALGLIATLVTPIASGGTPTLPLIGEVTTSVLPTIIILICALFILKSALAIILHWYATRRFAKYELEVGNRLFRAFTYSSWEVRSSHSTADITRIVDSSIAQTNAGFILPLSQVPNNAMTFLAMVLVLFITEPVAAIISVFYLGLVFLVMMLFISRKAREAGMVERRYSYRTATVITEIVDTIKEVTLRNKLGEAAQVVSGYRKDATRARANKSFLSVVPRYAFEAALIGGILLVGGVGFLSGGIEQALVSVAMFAATGFRMIPAMNNVQSGFTNASANLAYATDVIQEVKRAESDIRFKTSEKPEKPLTGTPRSLKLENVHFRYPGSDTDVLKGLSFEVPFGKRIGIVGPSGAGKSTLVDLILGLSMPTSGNIKLNETPIDEVLTQWRNHVGFVPQRVSLFNGTIAQNVALTWTNDFDEARVVDALQRAQLGELLEDRADGIHEIIGERGMSISGGQQQRLGIARALYADPLILVFDEATSSLDTATEAKITQAMDALAGEVTSITIAHRLSTIRNYDWLCYLDEGQIKGAGSFLELVEQVPDFRSQAQLAGLL